MLIEHTYTLQCAGFISPGFLNRCAGQHEVRVEDRRKIALYGMDLVLGEDEPDLPVGSLVTVWLDRNFRCESLEFVEHKKAITSKLLEEKEIRNRAAVSHATRTYLHPTQSLLEQTPESALLRTTLDMLYEEREKHSRIYRQFWHCTDVEKEKSNHALSVCDVLNKAIALISGYCSRKVSEAGVMSEIGYAYSPREGASDGFYSPGTRHFMLKAPIKVGRLSREARDALCKPAAKFWGLSSLQEKHAVVTCKQCLYKMITLIAATTISEGY